MQSCMFKKSKITTTKRPSSKSHSQLGVSLPIFRNPFWWKNVYKPSKKWRNCSKVLDWTRSRKMVQRSLTKKRRIKNMKNTAAGVLTWVDYVYKTFLWLQSFGFGSFFVMYSTQDCHEAEIAILNILKWNGSSLYPASII